MSHLRTLIHLDHLSTIPLAHTAGAGWDDDRTPLVCVCPHPQPEPVRLWDHVIVAGAYECRRCRRPTHLATDTTTIRLGLEER
jgi:hypothetical protein